MAFRNLFGYFSNKTTEQASSQAAMPLPVAVTTDSYRENNDSAVEELLRKFSKNWENRAQVRKRSFNDLPVYEVGAGSRPDFLERFLPFHQSDYYQDASDAMKSKILTCGWLIYNEKTLAIETDIVTPACNDIVRCKVPGLTDRYAREVASSTVTDEAFHSDLVFRANNITKEARGFDLCVPEFELISQMNAYKALHSEGWKKSLTMAATAIVSEIFISNYLKCLSDCNEIQPFNKAVVYAHRMDEMAHGQEFKLLAKQLYKGLSPEEQTFFSQVLPLPVRWFASKEITVWESVLTQIGFEHTDALIAECRTKEQSDLSSLDFSSIVKLASEIGVTSNPQGLRAFSEEGLIQPTREATFKL